MCVDYNKYVLTFIDDFRRRNWFCSFKYNSKALDKFKEIKILLEKKTNYNIKILSSNRGKEFNFNNFRIITKVTVFINNL